MNAATNAKEILKHLQHWSKENTRLIIGIDGYAGTGKTTIANALLELCPDDIELLHLDDFIQPVEKRIEMIRTFPDPSLAFEKHWYRYDVLQDLLSTYKENTALSFETMLYDFDTNTISKKHRFDLSKKILLLEGIFLFHPENGITPFFDKRIFLDTPFEIADARRIQREKEKWGENYQDESHPDNWTRYFIEAYRRYTLHYHPEILCDLSYS